MQRKHQPLGERAGLLESGAKGKAEDAAAGGGWMPEGPVYLRSTGHKLPDLVAALNGQIDVALDREVYDTTPALAEGCAKSHAKHQKGSAR